MSSFQRVIRFYEGRNMFNVSYRKVGGLRFVKVGRLCLSWSVSREYWPL